MQGSHYLEKPGKTWNGKKAQKTWKNLEKPGKTWNGHLKISKLRSLLRTFQQLYFSKIFCLAASFLVDM